MAVIVEVTVRVDHPYSGPVMPSRLASPPWTMARNGLLHISYPDIGVIEYDRRASGIPKAYKPRKGECTTHVVIRKAAVRESRIGTKAFARRLRERDATEGNRLSLYTRRET